MEKLVELIIKWLTLGPLKGYRTQILAVALFALAGLRATGVISLDQQTYDAITTALTGAIGLTAAFKKG